MTRLLKVLEWQMWLLQTGQRADYDLVEDALHYMIHYADEYHHVREDAVFDAVAARDPAYRDTADRLRQDHLRLAEKSLTLYRIVQQIARDGVTPRERLTTAAADYLTAQRNHMRHEEHTLFVRAEQVLSDEDRAAIDAALRERDDPLFGPAVAERYRQRYAQLVGGG